jgi:hypothetical protein
MTVCGVWNDRMWDLSFTAELSWQAMSESLGSQLFVDHPPIAETLLASSSTLPCG